jgi:peptidylprolyl isomerase
MWAPGTLVEFHFRGTLDNGSVFDSSEGRAARVFALGRGQLIPAFEEQISRLRPGEEVRFRIEADEAYGPHDPDLVISAPLDELPVGMGPGDEVPLAGGRPATVISVDADSVTLDANHPLAGHVLNFEVRLVSATPPAGANNE